MVRREKRVKRNKVISLSGVWNGDDLRHMLYLASSARLSPAVDQDQSAGARYCRGSARPLSCSALKSTHCGHDFEWIQCSEIFLKSLIKEWKGERKKSGIILLFAQYLRNRVETPTIAHWLQTIKTKIIPNRGFCILFATSSSIIVS